jgi:molecular chaperone HtpG
MNMAYDSFGHKNKWRQNMDVSTNETTTNPFKAETKQLLNILIHSLYTDKDIFLRELISNASDAISRLNFEILTNKEVLDGGVAGEIRIKINKDLKTITIQDTGIGMNSAELAENLGTIAHSGAKAFIEAASNHKEGDLANIIGQFGVGFYSAFMVAEKIEVLSRSYRLDDKAALWISDGGETYQIMPGTKENRGTEITLYLKEDATEYLENYRLRQIIKRHSDYIPYPIFFEVEEEQINRQTAIWRQQPNQVKEEEYKEFYKQFTFDFTDPIHHLHLSIDAPIQLYALLFIPSSPEPNVFSDRKDFGLKLYARKVLIQEFTKELLPDYLRFIQGVVDSEDIPLNVSREAFQSTKTILQIKKILTSKILDLLTNIAKNKNDQYLIFWKEFGIFIKEGLATTQENEEQLLSLLRVKTIYKKEILQTLDEYIETFLPEQKKIYYYISENNSSVDQSPHLEIFKKRNIDVILFTDPIDPFMLMRVNKYKDFDLVNVTAQDIDLPPDTEEESKSETDQKQPENLPELLTFFKTILGDRIKAVNTTQKLVESPARLVDSEGSPSPEMQKAYRYLQKEFEVPQKILEINPQHPIMLKLSGLQGINPLREIIIEQLYENCLLAEGIQPDTNTMIKRINRLIETALD